MNALLSVQSRGKKAKRFLTYEELKQIPTPDPTDTFVPLPHHEFVDAVVSECKALGAKVEREEFTVSARDRGQKFFGVIDLSIPDAEDPDYRFCVGLRNANNRTLAAGMAMGLRVFNCDNLTLAGDFFVIRVPHKPGPMSNLIPKIQAGLARNMASIPGIRGVIDTLRTTPISPECANTILAQAVLSRIIPPGDAGDIFLEYYRPDGPGGVFPDSPFTGFRLLNAFTEVFKATSPTLAALRSRHVLRHIHSHLCTPADYHQPPCQDTPSPNGTPSGTPPSSEPSARTGSAS